MEIISVSEFRKILLEIDNCKGRVVNTTEDGTVDYDEDCCMQVMCDACIERLGGLLEWAEDLEEEDKAQLTLPLNPS